MIKFQQIIYCNENSEENSSGVTAEKLISGEMFRGRTFSQLGIQAPPGTKFYVNTGVNPVIIGYTGLFQIDLTAGCSITNLRFDAKSIEFIEQNDGLYLIIDMAFEGGN